MSKWPKQEIRTVSGRTAERQAITAPLLSASWNPIVNKTDAFLPVNPLNNVRVEHLSSPLTDSMTDFQEFLVSFRRRRRKRSYFPYEGHEPIAT